MKTKLFLKILLIVLLANISSVSFAQTSTNSRSNWLEKFHLTGKDIHILVFDLGRAGDHLDINYNISLDENLPIHEHPTEVSGVLIGRGLINPITKGIAISASLTFALNKDFSYDFYPFDSLAEVSSNSWGTALAPTDRPLNKWSGSYDGASVDLDLFTKINPNYSVLFSIGNQGELVPNSYFTVSKSLAGAKNLIVVGGVDYKDSRPSYSSCGPTYDGRLKPDIVALSENILTTINNNKYATVSGTSFSTPIVAGVVTQLREGYKKIYGTTCSASLMKTFLCNTAQDLENPGPDYHTGFGRINAREAYRVMANKWFWSGDINQGDVLSHNINAPSNIKQLKVMLSWWDENGDGNLNKNLWTDLDIQIISPSGDTILPFVLDPLNPSQPAFRGVDTLNNIEQVVINNPVEGKYRVRIIAKTVLVLNADQTYEVSYNLVQDQLILTHPIGRENFKPASQEIIIWDYFGSDSALKIEYSSDNGSTWKTVISSIPSTVRYYDWTVPNEISGSCLVRVSEIHSSMSDMSDTTFSIMNQIKFLKVTPYDRSVLLSWGESFSDAKYEVFIILNGQRIFKGVTTQSQYLINGLSDTTYWFCIRAIDTSKNNAIGQYSIARSGTPYVGIEEEAPSTISIYSYGNIIQIQGCQNPDVQIYDLLGKQILKLRNQNEIILDNYLSSGIYILRVSSGSNTLSKRIFVQ